ncbi:MAG: GNAT family N-acetyltransferase [Bacteroidales bacterium]|nr:GNAT family N-acetyltransferase [Bacteroidales bacterium]
MLNDKELYLRAVEIEDVDKLYLWENDTEQWSVGLSERFVSRYALENYVLTSQNEDIFSSCQMRNILVHKGEAVGCVDLFDIDFKNSRSAIGLYIDKEHRNKGYSQSALKLLEEYASQHLLLHQIYALIGEKNMACRRLFEKSSYTHTATLPEWIKRKDCFEDVLIFSKTL